MQEVQAICDRVVIINKGIIVANDTVNNLLNTQNQNPRLKLVFDQNIDVSTIEAIKGVQQIKQVEAHTYIVTISKELDPRGDLFNVSSTNGWSLLESKQEIDNMENIFHQLTQD